MAAERVCTLCASVGIFRWLRTCQEIGHHARVRREANLIAWSAGE